MLRLDEPDPAAAWDERVALLRRSADALTERSFDAIELSGPGTELTVGLLPSSAGGPATSRRATACGTCRTCPTEEVFTTPDPARTEGTSPRRSRSC